MHNKSLSELKNELDNGNVSSVELTQHHLQRIQQHDSKLNSFITLCEQPALAAAKAADEQRAAGNAGPLTGLPLAHKDIFSTDGTLTTCGSHMLKDFVPPYNATIVEKFSNAGMVMLGKTNMDEFAMGSSNENSYFGPVKNPWDLDRVPGGSSGGSSAAVAARLVPAATGTDTGGSIRQPAALCGITGIKPTYGRVSRFGMIAFASSLDQGGVFARTAEDTALLLNAIAGFDEKDSTSVDHPVPDYTAQLNESLKGVRIGLPKEYFAEGLDPQIGDIVHAAADKLETLGATLTEVSLPRSNMSTAAYYVIAPAECSSNLARFDGVRFGHRAENPADLTDFYKRNRQEGFGEEVKRRILIGTYLLSSGYYDAYYKKAQQIRRLISENFQNAFKNVDLILSPTTPSIAFGIGEKTADPVSMYLSDIYTISVNLAGLPGISIPAGFSEGLPVGMQLLGNYFSEDKLLNVAHQYQCETDWHQRVPENFE